MTLSNKYFMSFPQKNPHTRNKCNLCRPPAEGVLFGRRGKLFIIILIIIIIISLLQTKIGMSCMLKRNHFINFCWFLPSSWCVNSIVVEMQCHGWPSTQPGTCTQPCPIVHTAVPPLFTQPCPGRTMSTAVCIYVAGLCASCPAV